MLLFSFSFFLRFSLSLFCCDLIWVGWMETWRQAGIRWLQYDITYYIYDGEDSKKQENANPPPSQRMLLPPPIPTPNHARRRLALQLEVPGPRQARAGMRRRRLPQRVPREDGPTRTGAVEGTGAAARAVECWGCGCAGERGGGGCGGWGGGCGCGLVCLSAGRWGGFVFLGGLGRENKGRRGGLDRWSIAL